MKTLLPLLLTVFVAGCIPLSSSTKTGKTNSTDTASVQSTEKLTRVVEGEKTPVRPVTVVPQPNITVTGSSNTFTFSEPVGPTEADRIYDDYLKRKATYRETITYGGATDSATDIRTEESWYMKKTIPLGLTLILLGAGLIILVIAIKYAINASASGKAFAGTVDDMLANRIREFRNHAASSTSTEDIAFYQAQIADLESARGKLTVAAKAKP